MVGLPCKARILRACMLPLVKGHSALFSTLIFLYYFRIIISDNDRSEGSEGSLPNETTVKFINEVSSKVSVFLFPS